MVKSVKSLRIALCLVLGAVLLIPSAGSSSAAAQDAGTPFTVAVIPDTQIYVQSDQGASIFRGQFEWIVEQQAARNIVFVSHEGDVAQEADVVAQWDRIESIYEVIDDIDMPNGIAVGNHDMKTNGTAEEYDARFGVDRYAGKPWVGGNHALEGNRSSYQTLEVEGHKLLFLHLRHLQPQFGEVGPVLEWADQVLAEHQNHLVFVTTHEFTASDGSLVIPALRNTLQDHCNVVAVFSGHRAGETGRGTFDDGCGRTIHHVLTNYQFLEDGGRGFLRLVTVDPTDLRADFSVYSPLLDTFRTGTDEEFTVPLAPIVPVLGDVSCDGELTVFDAVFIAKFITGERTAAVGCPLTDPNAQLNADRADANGDGVVNVLDAVTISQCVARVPNQLCP